MAALSTIRRELVEYVDRKQDRLIELTRELIRIPSENTPPSGNERKCQEWIAQRLSEYGLSPDVYELSEVAGLEDHPLYFAGRDYRNRPNVGVRRNGLGGGRSLLLTGHIDTVPHGTQDWTRDPFGAAVEGNHIYGRGSNDMKAGIAANLFVLECAAELELPLKGDLLFESVVDEEFGGCNGTLAGRLRGWNADAAVLAEPTGLRICPAQRGGRTAHITFHTHAQGILTDGQFPSGVIPQLTGFISAVPEFARQRTQQVRRHEAYADQVDPVPVSITKVFTGPWGTGEPITVPDKAQVELYWQLMPGETQDEVEREFLTWLGRTVQPVPTVNFPIRWLPGSAISFSEPLVIQLAEAAETVLGQPPGVTGFDAPCDLFVLQQGFGMPAVLWGCKGANTHAADEYVEIDSLVSAAKSLLLFVADWCE